ncbi:porin [Paraburkholderia phymatum]|uniref:porin n=1 Tax=Paraburkholderia phymatum TaxID=148447 RepID=UPI00317E20E8
MNKRKFGIGAALMTLSTLAAAQSSVTLYGVISEGIAWVNNDGGNRNIKLLSGVNQNNRMGFRITEDLGAGNHALAVLENGFDITSGKLQQGGRLFGRQAFVGLANDQFGTVTFGRQYDMFWDYFLPWTTATTTGSEAAHPGDADNLFGTWRYSNSVKYKSPTIGGFNAEALYAFSNASGDFANNRAFSVGAGYTHGPLKLAAAYVELDRPGIANTAGAVTDDYQAAPFLTFQTSPVNKVGVLKQRNAGVGGQYDFGHGLRLNALYDTVRYSYLDGTAFRLDNYDISVSYYVTPALLLGAGYVYSGGQYHGIDANPHWHTAAINVDYFLSKRTDVFAFADFQRVSGPGSAVLYLNSPSSSNMQSMVVLGMRHTF